MKRIVFFQLESFHEEIIPSFSESCVNTSIPFTIFTNKKAFNSKGNILKESIYSKKLNDNTEFHDGDENPEVWDYYYEKILSFEPSCVVFLTFYSDCVMAISEKLSKRKIKNFAVVHNTKKTFALEKASYLLKKNLVSPIFLSKHVQESFSKLNGIKYNNDDNIFYNIFSPIKKGKSIPDSSKLKIAICGSINHLNFDYFDLIKYIKYFAKNHKNPELEFILPAGGRSRNEVIDYVNQNQLEKFFIFPKLNEFKRCYYSDYYNYVRLSDFILCLKRIKIGARLEEFRITSTIPTGISFAKPFISNNKVSSLYLTESCSIIGKDIGEQLEKISFLYNNDLLRAERDKLTKNIEKIANDLKLHNKNVIEKFPFN